MTINNRNCKVDLLTVCFVCAAVAETKPLILSITLDKESVAVGKPVTATYEVTGGTGALQISTWWVIESAGGTIYSEHTYHSTNQGMIRRMDQLNSGRRDCASAFRR